MCNKGFSEFEWEIRESRDGSKTLLLGGRYVHSSYNPLKHAQNMARELIRQAEEKGCDHMVIIGLGLGYIPKAMYECGFKKIIVWDPFPLMQKSFPVCSGEWLNEVTVVSEYSEFKREVSNFARTGSRPKLVIHPGYDIFCRLEHRLAVQTLDRIYNDVEGGTYVISRRSLDALERLPFLGTVKGLEGLFKGRRAVLVSPGPSLKQYVNVLKDDTDIVVFASLQSVYYLQQNGVKVNFIVCADPNDMSNFMNECSSAFDYILADTNADPRTLDREKERTCLFHIRCGQIHEMLWEQAGLPIIDEPTATVSEIMLLLSEYMGFDEIYCIGMDFCWKEERYSYRNKDEYEKDRQIMNAMPEFRLMTYDNQIATTHSHYYHGSRFMRGKTAVLHTEGRHVYQTAGGMGFTTNSMLNAEELKIKLHTEKAKGPVRIEKQRSPFNTEQVRSLVNDIKVGKIKSRETCPDEGKLWPFLQELPVEERSEACDIIMNLFAGV